MRREGVDAHTPAPLALNATTDRRLELLSFAIFVFVFIIFYFFTSSCLCLSFVRA